MKILVVGRNGQLASALRALKLPDGVSLTALGRPDLDVLRPDSIRDALAATRPDIVINTAAFTAVDKAESEPDAAFALNAEATEDVAAAGARQGVPIVHISTDYVFDGTKSGPYTESDATAPLGVYGQSKLAGEEGVARANPRHAIVRTAWLHSAQPPNFLVTMRRLAESRKAVRVVDDQKGSPTFAGHLAEAILAIATEAHRNPAGFPWGIFHAAGGGSTTWFGLAEEFFRQSRLLGLPFAEVEPITIAEYPTAARRPANSVLDCGRLKSLLGVALPDWRSGVEACAKAMRAQSPQGSVGGGQA